MALVGTAVFSGLSRIYEEPHKTSQALNVDSSQPGEKFSSTKDFDYISINQYAQLYSAK